MNGDDMNGADLSRLHILSVLLPPVILIVAVLGSILVGIATPTEAAAMGAVGAIMLSGRRLKTGKSWLMTASLVAFALLAFQILLFGPALGGLALVTALVLAGIGLAGLFAATGTLQTAGILMPVMQASVRITVMIFTILVGGRPVLTGFQGAWRRPCH